MKDMCHERDISGSAKVAAAPCERPKKAGHPMQTTTLTTSPLTPCSPCAHPTPYSDQTIKVWSTFGSKASQNAGLLGESFGEMWGCLKKDLCLVASIAGSSVGLSTAAAEDLPAQHGRAQ